MKKYLCVSLFFLMLIPLSAQTPKRFNYGVYTGWTFGTSREFRTSTAPHIEERYQPKYHLGTYLQFNVDRHLSLQLNFNLQSIRHQFKSCNTCGDESQFDSYNYVASLTLNAVVASKRLSIIKIYMSSGAGLSFGAWSYWPDVYYNFTIEPGLKFYFFKSNPNIAFKLGFSAHYLRGTKKLTYSDDKYVKDASYARLVFGIEF
ncbi:hypothetical protein ACFLR7_06125 [Acidobacteriota bacterium]